MRFAERTPLLSVTSERRVTTSAESSARSFTLLAGSPDIEEGARKAAPVVDSVRVVRLVLD